MIVRSRGVDGEVICVEVGGVPEEDPAARGTLDWGWGKGAAARVVEQSEDLVAGAMETARTVARSIGSMVGELGEEVRPDELQAEIAIALDAAAGAVLTRLGAEASFKLTLTWRRGSAPPG